MTLAANVALRDQLAAAIRAEAPLPMSTDAVAEAVLGKPHGWTIYRHLRLIENRGLIARLWLPNDNRVFWHWVAPTSDDGLDAFEFTTDDLGPRHPDRYGKRGTP